MAKRKIFWVLVIVAILGVVVAVTARSSRAEAAVRIDGNLAEAHELLGGLFERKRQLPEAAREYRRAVEARPDFSRAHLRLGTVQAAQGNIADAAKHLREAAKASDAAIAQQAAKALQQLGAR